MLSNRNGRTRRSTALALLDDRTTPAKGLAVHANDVSATRLTDRATQVAGRRAVAARAGSPASPERAIGRAGFHRGVAQSVPDCGRFGVVFDDRFVRKATRPAAMKRECAVAVEDRRYATVEEAGTTANRLRPRLGEQSTDADATSDIALGAGRSNSISQPTLSSIGRVRIGRASAEGPSHGQSEGRGEPR